jgi:hypothetical protein
MLQQAKEYGSAANFRPIGMRLWQGQHKRIAVAALNLSPEIC